jgi:hypothetical protein
MVERAKRQRADITAVALARAGLAKFTIVVGELEVAFEQGKLADGAVVYLVGTGKTKFVGCHQEIFLEWPVATAAARQIFLATGTHELAADFVVFAEQVSGTEVAPFRLGNALLAEHAAVLLDAFCYRQPTRFAGGKAVTATQTDVPAVFCGKIFAVDSRVAEITAHHGRFAFVTPSFEAVATGNHI